MGEKKFEVWEINLQSNVIMQVRYIGVINKGMLDGCKYYLGYEVDSI